jgi:hypothetical protein
MDALWIGVIGTSVIAYVLKFSGHSVPEKFLSHPLCYSPLITGQLCCNAFLEASLFLMLIEALPVIR